MARKEDLPTIVNPLIDSRALLSFLHKSSEGEAIDTALFKVSLLTQVAGILLRLPQEIIATSIILLQRHVTSTAGDNESLGHSYEADSVPCLVSAACVFIAAKQSFYPLAPRSIINVYALLTCSTASPLNFVRTSASELTTLTTAPAIEDYIVSEGTYQNRRDQLFTKEKQILASLAFDVKVCLPYSLALTYLQALSAFSQDLATRVLAHLNGSLLSPQLLYMTHQPHALAVAAIYLAAREIGFTLVDQEVSWWEVFDVDREELGFLILSMSSLQAFIDHNDRQLGMS